MHVRLAVAFVAIAVMPAEAADIHYAPRENLERIDVAALGAAQRTIDMAAYVLTDWPVIQALVTAAERGVIVRVYVDGGQAGQTYMDPAGPFGKLVSTSNVTVKEKHPGRPIMHLKSYCVDGHLFRSGSANLTASGLKQQDNDLLLIDDPSMCASFTRDFDEIWTGKDAE